MNNIILFASYWNEIDWIEASLAQIDCIDPIEIIICDGCFDDRYPLHSTDGTREIIEKWVNGKENARLISPKRFSKLRGTWEIFKGHDKSAKLSSIKFSRLFTTLLTIKLVPYRINQGLTFNTMISLSKYWEPGRWFMTYDCDQFYSDSMIEKFSIVNQETDLGLLQGKEKTFFTDFISYTRDYEKRTYNNMPHRIYSNTTFVPTRNPIVERIFLRKYYFDIFKTKNIGDYYHYKLKSPERSAATYQVGDRKAPNVNNYGFADLEEPHPSIINRYFRCFLNSEK